jgi:hypothetical protein
MSCRVRPSTVVCSISSKSKRKATCRLRALPVEQKSLMYEYIQGRSRSGSLLTNILAFGTGMVESGWGSVANLQMMEKIINKLKSLKNKVIELCLQYFFNILDFRRMLVKDGMFITT